MAEYIEREALLKAYLDLALAKSKAAKARKGLAAFHGDLFPVVELTEKEFVGLINAAPVADVVEVVHGRWKYDNSVNFWKCSHCGVNDPLQGKFMQLKTKYCPNCGVRMDGE